MPKSSRTFSESRPRNGKFVEVVAAIGALLILATGCSRPEPADSTDTSGQTTDLASGPRFRNIDDNVEFTGDAVCATCHEEQWSGFQSHGMANSYYPMTVANAVEDFDAPAIRHPNSGLLYKPFRRDTSFYIEEFLLDAARKKVHSLVRRIDFVMGSGTAARTYTTEDDGRLYEMPITWYTQKRKWDFSPGYEVSDGRFSRLIPDRCMVCHNSYPETVPFAEGKFKSVPNGIGCERCHGPGALHVEERLISEDAGGDVDDSIVNPAHLALDRQLDVCQQCHLQTTVSILRDGQDPFAFRPSQSLADHLALFAEDKEIANAETIDVISHADRMKASACFLATVDSASPLTCTTCHNPHQGFRSAGPAYFSDTCRTCHAVSTLTATLANSPSLAAHTATADCASCHMAKIDANAVPHSSFTDHWVRIVGDDSALSIDPIRTGGHLLTPYFERDQDAGSQASIYSGMASIVYGKQRQDTAAFRSGIGELQASLRDGAGFGEAYYLLGFAQVAIGETRDALSSLEEAVRRDPDVPERLNTLALAYEAAGRDAGKIRNLYTRALTVQPAAAEIRVNFGRFLEKQGQLEEARSQYEQAISEQPWLSVAHYNLGTVLLRVGDIAAAEHSLLEAIRLDPNYDAAMGNLGLLYATSGDEAKALGYFEDALRAAPNSPVALSNLARYRFNAGNYNAAIELLERLVQVQPASTEAFADLAHAYFLSDDYSAARRTAERALAIDPSNARARQILDAVN